MKRILLAVCGLSPQVITETLYALHQNYQLVDAIHVITTRDGKEGIFAQLLSGKSGHYYRYLAEYGIDANSIDFGPDNIHVITDEHGNEIPDIVSESDNERLLGKCLELAFRFTADPATAVFFSIAGGRKTMSAFMALALQLYGREQDDMVHILVPDDKMRPGSDWFFPQDPSREDEKMELSYVPVLKVGRYLKTELNIHPEKLVHKLQTVIRERFNLENLIVNGREIICDNHKLSFSPKKAAVYRLLLRKKMNATCEESCIGCEKCSYSPLELLDAFENGELYREYIKVDNPYSTRADKMKHIKGLDTGNIYTDISRIRSDIDKSDIPPDMKKALRPEMTYIPYEDTYRYTLNLNKKIIRFIKED